MKFVFRCGLIVTAFVLLGGCSLSDRQKKGEPEKVQDTVQVAVMVVHPDTFIESSIYYGRLFPKNEARLICYSGGYVESIAAKEGEFVKAGASLAAIDSAKASALLGTSRLQEQIALKNYEQAKKHLTEGNASQLAVDQAHLAYLGAHNSTIDAEKNYRGALAITPLSGIVTFCNIEKYQEIPPGSPTFTIARTSTMKVYVALIESDALRISIGTRAVVNATDDTLLSGRVTSIALQATESDKTFRTQITVKNPGNLLMIGATAKVKIEVQRHSDALCVPTAVIRSDGVQYSVMVCTDENRAVRRIITPGPQSDSTTMVTEGLLVGDQVIISGQQLAAEGSPVKISQR
jgi:RND family efflux transporter MFP subunit